MSSRRPEARITGLIIPATSRTWSAFESALALATFADAADSVRRAEANTIREALAIEAERLEVEVPPSTIGDPRAWDSTLERSVDRCRMLATGQLV